MMTRHLEWYILFWLHLIVLVTTDFQCVCNYSKYGVPVYQNTTRTSIRIGVLDINDCKQYLYPTREQSTTFYAIMYRHQIGFVMEIQTKEINCQGTPPVKDIVTVPSLSPTELTDHLIHFSSRQAETSSTAVTKPLQMTSTYISQRQNNSSSITFKQLTSLTTTQSPSTTRRSSTKKTSTDISSVSTNMSTISLKSLVTLPLNLRTTPTPPVLPDVTTVRPYTGTLSTLIISNTNTGTTNPVPPSITIDSTEGTMQQCTNEAPTTAAIKSIDTISVVKGHIEMCPQRLQTLADQSREYIAQYAQNCYEIVQTRVSWSHAESNCKHNGGHLIHIASQQEQDFIYSFLKKHHSLTVWLGLHDRNQEECFEWTSGNPVTYTNWIPGRKDYRYHNSEDCVLMTTVKGQWDDIQCGGDNALSELFQGIRHAYICQYATVNPPTTVDPLNFDGNTKMCPYSLRQQAIRDSGVLGQYDHSCYEFVPNTSVAWQHAEEICHNRGGHLAYISNIQEQAFVQTFLNRYSPNHAVWIGLTDNTSEGHFHWTSGTPVQYTNWVPGHVSNYVSSSEEDCVVFIPYKNGQWDDIPCGSTRNSFFGGTSSSGETHPLLCQYPISAGPSLIG